MLKKTYIQLLTKYTEDEVFIIALWNEIEGYYSNTNRFYHNLQHLEHTLYELISVKKQIENWDAILFAFYYHDIIYDSIQSNNEELSAIIASERMKEIGVSKNTIDLTQHIILATQTHQFSKNKDVNYFTDADLSILGQDWKAYHRYFENIRKEYASYPDLTYFAGREKVLVHFLNMDQIFKTSFFKLKYEKQARINLKKEWDIITVTT